MIETFRLTGGAETFRFPTMTPDALRAELEARGAATQEQAAVLLGVSQMTISRWLRGRARIHPGTIAYLSATRTAQDAPKTRRARTRKASIQKG